MLPIFDGHNDVLLRLMKKSEPDGGAASFLDGDGAGHLDLPRAKAGGLAGGLFAVFVPPREKDSDRDAMMAKPEYDVPLPEQPDLTYAQAIAFEMVSLLFRIERRSGRRGARLPQRRGYPRKPDATVRSRPCCISRAPSRSTAISSMLEILYEAGLRSLGMVWSRPNIFGHGVPFRFPSSPDTGAGLTDTGKALVKACNELGIVIDLSHLNEKGFWDVAGFRTHRSSPRIPTSTRSARTRAT